VAAATFFAPGTVVGDFCVGPVLGVGGMAVVYRAQHLSHRFDAALKVMNRDVSDEPAFRERFRRESQYVAALVHPHIVPVYAFGEDSGCLFLAMKWVDGQTLTQRARRRPLGAAQAIQLLRGIADALDVAHTRGLVHRDVKPDNILLAANGYPYLADFGVAKDAYASDLTAGDAFVGTPNFAAPEQVRGGLVSAATDVYGLAGVLYYCLTGEAPHRRSANPEELRRQLSRPPRALPGDIPHASELDRVLACGMATAPKRRYRRAADLTGAAADALIDRDRRAVRSQSRRGEARAAGARRSRSPHDWLVFAGAVLLLVLCVAIAVISATWIHRH
jgi:serine/threonine protein kinase